MLSGGQTKEAYEEFHVNFLQAVKGIYSEASDTCPARFGAVGDWSGRMRELYVHAGKADKALAAGNAGEASKLLAALREDFFKLHREAGIMQVNDLVYALRMEAAKEQPSAQEIKSLLAKLAAAKPSSKSRKAATDFTEASNRFREAANPLLADNRIEPGEVQPLRQAAEPWYQAFGVEFE